MAPDQGRLPSQEPKDIPEGPGNAQTPAPEIRRPETPDGHEGATEEQVGDRTGPGVGYDQEPEPEPGDAGVA